MGTAEIVVQLFQPYPCFITNSPSSNNTNTINSLLSKRFPLLRSNNSLFMLTAVPKVSKIFLQLTHHDHYEWHQKFLSSPKKKKMASGEAWFPIILQKSMSSKIIWISEFFRGTTRSRTSQGKFGGFLSKSKLRRARKFYGVAAEWLRYYRTNLKVLSNLQGGIFGDLPFKLIQNRDFSSPTNGISREDYSARNF